MVLFKRDSGGKDRPSSVPEPVESLRCVILRGRLDASSLQLCLQVDAADKLAIDDRSQLAIYDGEQLAMWQAEPLGDLFRGDRTPPLDSVMAHYPSEYLPLFATVESNLLTGCVVLKDPTDADFLEVYTALRKRPDGKSRGPLHDIVWQCAALALGLHPYSQAEYEAVFAQLARSARHWKMGPSSRNYLMYLRSAFGDASSQLQ